MLTVLVVDDSPSVLCMLSAVLSVRGFLVLEAKNGGEALRILAGNAVDVVITDLLMPGMDGMELTRKSEECLQAHVAVRRGTAAERKGRDVTSWVVKSVPPARLSALIKKAAADVKTARKRQSDI